MAMALQTGVWPHRCRTKRTCESFLTHSLGRSRFCWAHCTMERVSWSSRSLSSRSSGCAGGDAHCYDYFLTGYLILSLGTVHPLSAVWLLELLSDAYHKHSCFQARHQRSPSHHSDSDRWTFLCVLLQCHNPDPISLYLGYHLPISTKATHRCHFRASLPASRANLQRTCALWCSCAVRASQCSRGSCSCHQTTVLSLLPNCVRTFPSTL